MDTKQLDTTEDIQNKHDSYIETVYKTIPRGVCFGSSCPCIEFYHGNDINENNAVFAGKYGHLHCIQHLFKKVCINFDIKIRIFLEVIKNEHLGCIEYISNTKLGMNGKWDKYHIITVACQCKNADALKILIDAGYELGENILTCAITNKSSNVLEYLLQNTKDLFNLPFWTCVSYGYIKHLKLLYEYAFKIGKYDQIKDPRGICPSLAIHYNHIECLEYLVSIKWDNAKKVHDTYLNGYKLTPEDIENLFKIE